MKNRQQIISFLGVILLALALPMVLKFVNNLVRYWVGAEGRLSAITVETNRELGPMPKPWLALAQGGQDLTTFLDTNATAVATLKPEYVRIDHVYDGFGVVKRDGEELVFDWARLDGVVNKMISLGAKPFLSLSYMPEALGADLTGEPRNWSEWSTVVQKTVERYSGRIEGVYYEVWNEPDLFGKWTMGGKKDYRNLYLYSVRGAEAAMANTGVKKFKIGGPATTGLYRDWVDGMFQFVAENNVRMDFVSWHRYDLSAEKYQEDVRSIEATLLRNPKFAGIEKVITEMGPNSAVGKENDTKVGAAQTVAAQRALMGKVDYGFNFAVAGDWGIVNKPRYNALKMLATLGQVRMPLTGEGSWVNAIAAKDGKSIQVLLTNYDQKNGHSEVVPVSFVSLRGHKFRIKTTNLEGTVSQQDVATSEAVLQRQIPMAPNDVVLVELINLE
jgi:hypothetical protein